MSVPGVFATHVVRGTPKRVAFAPRAKPPAAAAPPPRVARAPAAAPQQPQLVFAPIAMPMPVMYVMPVAPMYWPPQQQAAAPHPPPATAPAPQQAPAAWTKPRLTGTRLREPLNQIAPWDRAARDSFSPGPAAYSPAYASGKCDRRPDARAGDRISFNVKFAPNPEMPVSRLPPLEQRAGGATAVRALCGHLLTPFHPPATQGYGQYEGKKLANRPTRLRHEVRPRSAAPPRHPTGVPARVVPKSMAMAYQKIGGPHAFR